MNTPTNLEVFEGAGFIFVNQNYDFLLVQDTESKKWGMCKGHRDQNDADPLTTARREAHEELGLIDGLDYDVISGPLYIQGSPRAYIFYYAIIKTQMNNINLQKDEVCDIKWVRYHNLPNIINKDEYNIYLRLLVSTTIGKPQQQQSQSKPEVATTTETNFVPKYRLTITQPETNDRPGSCYPELMKDDYEEDEDEEEVIIEPPPSAIDMNEGYMFIPIQLDMVELLARSFSRPTVSVSPRSRSCTSPFIPIGLPSPRVDGTVSPFISV